MAKRQCVAVEPAVTGSRSLARLFCRRPERPPCAKRERRSEQPRLLPLQPPTVLNGMGCLTGGPGAKSAAIAVPAGSHHHPPPPTNTPITALPQNDQAAAKLSLQY